MRILSARTSVLAAQTCNQDPDFFLCRVLPADRPPDIPYRLFRFL